MKLKRLLLLPFFLVTSSYAVYQQQWFSQFQESDDGIQFVCEWQCVALIAPLAGSDYVDLQGRVQGSGIVGYGFLVGQQIAPAQTLPVWWTTSIDQRFTFNELPFYSQIPQDAQLVLFADGSVQTSHITLQLWYLGTAQRIVQWRHDFWSIETLTPYSINLRYWVSLLWIPLLHYAYWLFIIVVFGVIVLVKWNRQKKFRLLCFWWLGVFLFMGIRNVITYTWIVQQWVKQYTLAPDISKIFFDLWDYPTFTDHIRKTLLLDTQPQTCKILLHSYQDWPFKAHREHLYLKPCTLTLTWSEADYLIYYHMPIISGDQSKPILLQYHDNYLLQNK